MISLAKKLISEGTSNVFNLGSFIFGISGIIICLVVIIAPYKILEVMPLGYVKLFGYNLEKNGALGILLVSGVVIAAITQPLAGLISDLVLLDLSPSKEDSSVLLIEAKRSIC